MNAAELADTLAAQYEAELTDISVEQQDLADPDWWIVYLPDGQQWGSLSTDVLARLHARGQCVIRDRDRNLQPWEPDSVPADYGVAVLGEQGVTEIPADRIGGWPS